MDSILRQIVYVLEKFLNGKEAVYLPSAKKNLDTLVAPQDDVFAASVVYAYDPVPKVPQYIRPKLLAFPQNASRTNQIIRSNTIRLRPHAAGLPFRSSLDYVRATKHWKANLDETIKVLELLASDTSVIDVEVGPGITLAKLAKKELRPGLENRMVVATSHMFPSGDERRIRIIARSKSAIKMQPNMKKIKSKRVRVQW